MRRKLSFTALMMTVALTVSAERKPVQLIEEVPFTNVHLTDSFWAPRIETNRTVSIPSAFRECEVNGRFDNFALAATNLGHASYDVK